MVKNAKALAEAMIEEGFNLVSGGTDNHLILVDLQNMNITGKELQNRLDEVYITVNKNAVPNDPAKPVCDQWSSYRNTGCYNKRSERRRYEDHRKTDQDDGYRF